MGIMRTFNIINLQYKCRIIFTQEPRWFVRISREYLLREEFYGPYVKCFCVKPEHFSLSISQTMNITIDLVLICSIQCFLYYFV